jgi:hypothetical protein
MASLPRRLHLKSAIGGLGKAFYQKRFRRSELSPAYLAWLYAIEPADPQVIGSFEEFIHVTDFDRSSFRGYDFRDMFYWEHRMSAWESLSMLGYEAAHETVSPYGNRRVCELLLSAPLKDRLHHRVHTLAIERMWPELLEFTIGPATRRTLEAYAWQMLPYHTQRALRPLALRLLRTRDVRSGSPAGSCRPSLPRGSSDWGA